MTALAAVSKDDPKPAEVLPLPVLMGRVLADIPAVGKNEKAPSNMGGYSFRGIEDVLAALKPAMAKHGVFCVPHTLERIASERSVGQNKTMFVVDLWVEWTFRGPAGDELKADAWGCGTDMGDKATQKAMTSAFKSMLLQAFAIGDSASDSERHSVPETERPEPQPDPATWFERNGWKDQQHHDEWRTSVLDDIKGMDDADKADIKEWCESNGLDWKRSVPRGLAQALDSFLTTSPAPDATAPPAPPQEPKAAPLCPGGCGEPTHNCKCPSRPF